MRKKTPSQDFKTPKENRVITRVRHVCEQLSDGATAYLPCLLCSTATIRDLSPFTGSVSICCLRLPPHFKANYYGK